MPRDPNTVATQRDVDRVAAKYEEGRAGQSFSYDPVLDQAVTLKPGADPLAVDCSHLRELDALPGTQLKPFVELSAVIGILEENPQAGDIGPDVDLSGLTKPIVSDIRAGAAVCGKPKPSGPK